MKLNQKLVALAVVALGIIPLAGCGSHQNAPVHRSAQTHVVTKNVRHHIKTQKNVQHRNFKNKKNKLNQYWKQ